MKITWTQCQFTQMQRIARCHDIHCRLRVAMATGEDPEDGSRVCTCEGKLNRWGEPKTTPRERTLSDVLAQLGIAIP